MKAIYAAISEKGVYGAQFVFTTANGTARFSCLISG